MERRIAVLGSGAIGSSVGADLTAAGKDVTIIDQWPAHVEAMKADGLRIGMPDLDLHVPVRAMHLCDLASTSEPFDNVLLCVKAYDSRWMAQLIEPYIAPHGVLVSVQNSMTDAANAAIVGQERELGCCIELSAEIFTPGVVQRNTARKGTWMAVGEIDGTITPRAQEIADLLRNVAVVEITDNILGTKWTKLIANSMTMGPFGLLGLRNWEAAELPGMFEISVRLGRESLAVGMAAGYKMQPVFGLTAEEFAGATDEVLVKAMRTLLGHVGSRSRTAIVQDHIKGRRSESEHISGLVSRKGRELGVPTPCNDAVVEIDREINAGRLKMSVENFGLLKARIEGS